MLTSTVLTLVVIPVAYRLVADSQGWFTSIMPWIGEKLAFRRTAPAAIDSGTPLAMRTDSGSAGNVTAEERRMGIVPTNSHVQPAHADATES